MQRQTQPTMAETDPATVVAIDLGSNSFHLLKATLGPDGRLLPLLALASKVQLGLDLNENGLSPAAMRRGMDCLRGFAPHCEGLPTQNIRIVGTQALREAANRNEFIAQVEALFGKTVDIISGQQEAALAYRGVNADLGDNKGLLVVDVGGCSTELVIGRGDHIEELASLSLGCVSWLKYFPAGQISRQALEEARSAARAVFETVASQYAGGWQPVGCSGTLLAVAEVIKRQSWAAEGINRQGLEHLTEALLAFDHIDAVAFQGLSEDRRSIFASGTAIVLALFDSLQLDGLALSNYGLREGVAIELLLGLSADQ